MLNLNIKTLLTGTALSFACVAAMAQAPAPTAAPGATPAASSTAAKPDAKPAAKADAAKSDAVKPDAGKTDATKTPHDTPPVGAASEKTAPHAHKHETAGGKTAPAKPAGATDAKPAAKDKADVKKDATAK